MPLSPDNRFIVQGLMNGTPNFIHRDAQGNFSLSPKKAGACLFTLKQAQIFISNCQVDNCRLVPQAV
jgi:hypothetical protein